MKGDLLAQRGTPRAGNKFRACQRGTIDCKKQYMPGHDASNLVRPAGAPLGSSGPSDHHNKCRVFPGVLQDARCCVPIICVAEPILSINTAHPQEGRKTLLSAP